MLTIKNLSKDYFIDGKPFPALKGISLEFPSVQFVSVLGPSGCGKTTLLNLIGGLDRLSQGEILFRQKDVGKRSEKELDSYRNHHIGFIFQNYYLIPNLTVFENVKRALSVRGYTAAERKRRTRDVLEKVGIASLSKKRSSQLSGGQAQRAAIARALVTDPSILLADEPTGALDSENSKRIRELLKDISKDRLVILVTHNEELAKEYSDRLIRRKDGRITQDEILSACPQNRERNETVNGKSRLSLKRKRSLALHNLFSRKWKTVLSAIANSFGRIGIAFFLAINYGFSVYSNDLSVASATSLPVVVSSFDQVTQSENYRDKNQNTEYPDTDEIYPSLPVSSNYGYTRNEFSQKYRNYLNKRKEEGILSSYSINYGNSYNFNLTTEYPASLNGKQEGGRREVDTSKTSYNYYAYSAGLPYNIFHPLYGDLGQYDLLAGERPNDDSQLVLVVSSYNAISFSILQGLGFYNPSDTEDDVSDASLSSKVKPISFSDVLGKSYRIFDNDDYFIQQEPVVVTDADNNSRTIYRYEKKELTSSFYQSGKELKISAILRPKKGSNRNRLAPSLCFLPSLQEELVQKNEKSQVASTIGNNLVFYSSSGSKGENVSASFIQERSDLIEEFEAGKSKVLPTDKINDIVNRYFCYYPFDSSGFVYIGTSSFLSDSRKVGADLVLDERKTRDFNDKSTLDQLRNDRQKEYRQGSISGNRDGLYKTIVSLIAYANAYSQIQNIVLFPSDLSMRAVLLEKLDEFNSIQEGSDEHAANKNEQVFYHKSDASGRITDVAERISLVSTILIIFACISLVVSSARTGLLTSNNVLERKKEIGLLRSLGAKKGDVASVFEIESFLTGFLAGIIGSLVTYVLCFPINALLNKYYSFYSVGQICNFTFYHALLVILFSVILGMVSALIPAIKAGKEDPVKALKDE